MRNQREVKLFNTVDPKLLSMDTNEHRQEIFRNINNNKVSIDRTVFKTDRQLLKRMKSTVSNKTLKTVLIKF